MVVHVRLFGFFILCDKTVIKTAFMIKIEYEYEYVRTYAQHQTITKMAELEREMKN